MTTTQVITKTEFKNKYQSKMGSLLFPSEYYDCLHYCNEEELIKNLPTPVLQKLAQKHGDKMRSVALAEALTIYNSTKSSTGVAPWEIARPLDYLDVSERIFKQVHEPSDLKDELKNIQDTILK